MQQGICEHRTVREKSVRVGQCGTCGRLVAATTTTREEAAVLTPSNCTRNSVFNLRIASCSFEDRALSTESTCEAPGSVLSPERYRSGGTERVPECKCPSGTDLKRCKFTRPSGTDRLVLKGYPSTDWVVLKQYLVDKEYGGLESFGDRKESFDQLLGLKSHSQSAKRRLELVKSRLRVSEEAFECC
eukprot:293628-Rhodomonas_salina.1